MTKKDYRRLASMIVRLKNNNVYNLDRLDAIIDAENELIKELREDNYRFDLEKWEAFKEKLQVNC